MSFACRIAGLVLCCAALLPVRASAGPVAPPVTVTDDGPTYTLANGYLTVKVDKVTGDLVSVKTPKTVTPNIELMGFFRGITPDIGSRAPRLRRGRRRPSQSTLRPSAVNAPRFRSKDGPTASPFSARDPLPPGRRAGSSPTSRFATRSRVETAVCTRMQSTRISRPILQARSVRVGLGSS